MLDKLMWLLVHVIGIIIFVLYDCNDVLVTPRKFLMWYQFVGDVVDV